MPIRIYHNPRCSKSRRALELLRENGVEPEIVEYLESPPSPQEIESILNMLGLKPRELMRRKEPEYKGNGLDHADMSDAQLIQAIHDHPRIMERPVVVGNGRVVIGRPPENVLQIVES